MSKKIDVKVIRNSENKIELYIDGWIFTGETYEKVYRDMGITFLQMGRDEVWVELGLLHLLKAQRAEDLANA